MRYKKKLITSLDRAHRVVLGTRMEHLEHVLRRIAGAFTSISIVKSRFLELFMEIVLRYKKSDYTIGYSSSICTWNTEKEL